MKHNIYYGTLDVGYFLRNALVFNPDFCSCLIRILIISRVSIIQYQVSHRAHSAAMGHNPIRNSKL